jgi:hypothetical protein
MAPINTPNGNEVSEIVLPNGNPASEVIAPDGTQVFGAIPDSGDHQWYVDEGSGATLNDSVGSVSATINGATWEADSAAVGGQRLSHDGIDDYWETDSSLQLDSATIFGWVRPADFTSFSNQFASWGSDINGSGSGFYIDTEDTEGEILVAANDNDNGSVQISNVPFVNINERGFYALIYDGADYRIITFSATQELADQTSDSDKPDRFPTGSHNVYVGGNPTDSDHLTGDTDFTGVAVNRTLSKTEITEVWGATND